MPISDNVLDLFDYVEETTYEKPDRKLPVSHKCLQQQLSSLDNFLAKGYENTLTKAVLTISWAGQLRVSEYTTKIVADINAGHEDHNLGSGGVLVQEDGITLIFMSEKTS